MYVICNNDKYLGQTAHGYGVVNDINMAAKWQKIQKANNVLDNIKTSKKLNKLDLQVRYISHNNNADIVVDKVELDFDILDKVREIADFTRQIEKRRLYLEERIRTTDLEIIDIEHAAEFYNLNAAQGYKIYKMLHDARIRRREYKDELKKIELSLGTSIKSKNIRNLERSIIGLNNRKYTPRVNKELFGV